MSAVKISTHIDMNAARFAVKRAVGPVVRRRVEQAGKEMVRVANSLMAADFDLNRPYERRRHPGSRRASTALDYSITSDSSERLILRFRVLGGDEVFMRIMGMNYGVPAHTISPSGAWSLRGVSLATRSTSSRSGTGSSGNFLAWPENGGWRVVRGSVYWRPTGAASQGTHFLEEAAFVAAQSLGGVLAA